MVTNTAVATRGLSAEERQAVVREKSRESAGEKRPADDVVSDPDPDPYEEYQLQELGEEAPPEFNYLPYLVLAAVLLGMAYITDER